MARCTVERLMSQEGLKGVVRRSFLSEDLGTFAVVWHCPVLRSARGSLIMI